jgi:uncharacterized protein YecT (DUF1311 family)
MLSWAASDACSAVACGPKNPHTRSQEETRCAEQVASQVDAALQQAHRSLGYSLQETAAQRDPDGGPHRHMEASGAACDPACWSTFVHASPMQMATALESQQTQG